MSSEIGNEDTWGIGVAIARPIEMRSRVIREGGFHLGINADAENRGEAQRWPIETVAGHVEGEGTRHRWGTADGSGDQQRNRKILYLVYRHHDCPVNRDCGRWEPHG